MILRLRTEIRSGSCPRIWKHPVSISSSSQKTHSLCREKRAVKAAGSPSCLSDDNCTFVRAASEEGSSKAQRCTCMIVLMVRNLRTSKYGGHLLRMPHHISQAQAQLLYKPDQQGSKINGRGYLLPLGDIEDAKRAEVQVFAGQLSIYCAAWNDKL